MCCELQHLCLLHCPCLQDYLAGRWPQAREAFEELLHARTRTGGGFGGPAVVVADPPTRTLLSFMAGHGYVAPKGWAGVRELTEK